jgi:hypothetical protein
VRVQYAIIIRVGRVAQLGERCVRNAEVGSSILPASTNHRSRSQAKIAHPSARREGGPVCITTRATVGNPAFARLRRFHAAQFSSHDYTTHMTPTTMVLKHVPSPDNRLCSGCNAEFVPSEDSGSRVLSLHGAHEFTALLCGGCHSKWSHGSVLTLKGPLGD